MLDDTPPSCLDYLIFCLRPFDGSFQCHEINTVKSCPMTAFFYIPGHCCTGQFHQLKCFQIIYSNSIKYSTIMRRLTMEIHSEKCVIVQMS